MDIMLSIFIPVVIAMLVAAGVYGFLKIFFNGKREEYKIISIAIAFLIGIFSGFGFISFLG